VDRLLASPTPRVKKFSGKRLGLGHVIVFGTKSHFRFCKCIDYGLKIPLRNGCGVGHMTAISGWMRWGLWRGVSEGYTMLRRITSIFLNDAWICSQDAVLWHGVAGMSYFAFTLFQLEWHSGHWITYWADDKFTHSPRSGPGYGFWITFQLPLFPFIAVQGSRRFRLAGLKSRDMSYTGSFKMAWSYYLRTAPSTPCLNYNTRLLFGMVAISFSDIFEFSHVSKTKKIA